MGCASSRAQHHSRPRCVQHPNQPHEQPHMSYYDATQPAKPSESEINTAHVPEPEPEPPKPPPPVARPHVRNRYAPRASYNPYDSPYSQRNYTMDTNGKSLTHTHTRAHALCVPQQSAQCTTSRDVSPPRHRSEMPRRCTSHQHRDVSPLGSSRFERPFERAHVGSGQGRVTTVGATFGDGGIGGWENW